MNFYLESLGCKVNACEIGGFRSLLLENGHQEVKDPISADVLLINTCSVTHESGRKSQQHIRRLRRLNPKGFLVVMGCEAERLGLEVLKLGVDLASGTHARLELLDIVLKYLKSGEKPLPSFISSKKEGFQEFPGASAENHLRAYLKIQDGCNSFCSYCLIPYLRGRSVSRDPRCIIEEAKKLTINHPELVLAGIHIGKYGLDLTPRNNLTQLIERILKEVGDLKRLRISSLEESEIDEEFLTLFAKEEKIANHLHLPLQSGSEKVLRLMGRPYTPSGYYENVQKARVAREDVAITTDLIAGFPGENDDDWKETMSFLRKCAFSELHVFPYSRREGTRASALNDLPMNIKKERVREALTLSDELSMEYRKKFSGQKVQVLFETFDGRYAFGHSSNYLTVKIPSSRSLRGEIHEIVYDSSMGPSKGL